MVAMAEAEAVQAVQAALTVAALGAVKEVMEVEMDRCGSLRRRCSIGLEGFCHSTDTAHTCKPANPPRPRWQTTGTGVRRCSPNLSR